FQEETQGQRSMCPGLIKVYMIVRRLVLSSHHSFGTEYLNPLIVSVDSLATVVYCSNDTVFKAQCYRRRVPIAHFLEYWIDQNIDLRIDLLDVRPYEETCHIEIMNGHIQEEST